MSELPPRYLVDYESVGRSDNPLEAIEQLVDRMARPNFWRGPACAQCENWTAKEGEDRPIRPFAPDPLEGCAGCVLSYLDVNPAWAEAKAEEVRRRREERPPRSGLIRPRTLVEHYHQRKP